jgi:N-acyl-D-amino-acid deacylase
MALAYDLVIRGGTVVDGSGGAPSKGDVAVAGDRIVAVGAVTGSGAEEIDAAGCIVTPGFVDVHTHYDGQVTWEQTLAPSSGHGVTSVVRGNCGVGFAPVRADQHELAIRLMEGVEDIPEVVMATGVPWNWESFPDYLDALELRKTDIDFAAQLPHSPLRVYVMGERGADLEPPTDHDLATMRRLTCEAVRAGALGVTTSRNFAHRFKSGELAPSVSTEDTEVLALADGLRDAGTGVFQIIPDTNQAPETQFALLRDIARRSGRPVSFTFMQTPHQPGGWRTIVEGLADAKQEGLMIRGQVLPRPTGALLGLELSLHPFSLNPTFRPIADLPLEEKVRVMRDPELRRRLLAESPQDPHPFFKYVVGEHEALYVLGDPPNYNPAVEDSIGARARAAGVQPLELIYDALLQRDGHEILYRPMGNSEGERFESSGRNLLDNDRTVLGLGDGGAHYSMICDAAYTTYFLTYWVRDAPPDRKVSVPEAIRMLTREPAETVGLLDRGLIHPGFKADLNVIDIDRLHLHAPTASYDLPAGGRRLSQRADGYRTTVVSGSVTYRDGVATGALPGRLVRGARVEPHVDEPSAAALLSN